MPYESFTRFTQDGLVLMFIAVTLTSCPIKVSILGKPRETLIGHDVSVTAMNMRANPSWVNHVKL
jgi:hypothetical protein